MGYEYSSFFCSKLNLPLPQQSAEIQIVHSWRSIKSQQQSSCLPSKSLIVPSFTPTKSPNSSIFVDETRKSSVNHCETTIFRCFNSRYLTARHEKIHHAIKFGKPGKPSISMGRGLTMAMLKNQRVYIYIYMVGRLWWMIFLGRLWWMIQKWISKIIHHNLPKIIPNNFHVLGRWLKSIWRLWWMIFFSTRG